MRFLQYLLYLIYSLLGKEAVRLNLRLGGWYIRGREYRSTFRLLRGDTMAKIGDTFTATIKPTNAAGAPAPVFGAAYDEDFGGFDGYDVTVAPDGLSAVLVAKGAGSGFKLRVSATTKSGLVLTETVFLPDVEPNVDDEAVALNLTVA